MTTEPTPTDPRAAHDAAIRDLQGAIRDALECRDALREVGLLAQDACDRIDRARRRTISVDRTRDKKRRARLGM